MQALVCIVYAGNSKLEAVRFLSEFTDKASMIAALISDGLFITTESGVITSNVPESVRLDVIQTLFGPPPRRSLLEERDMFPELTPNSARAAARAQGSCSGGAASAASAAAAIAATSSCGDPGRTFQSVWRRPSSPRLPSLLRREQGNHHPSHWAPTPLDPKTPGSRVSVWRARVLSSAPLPRQQLETLLETRVCHVR